MNFAISVRGDKDAARTLYKIASKARHAKPILRQVGGEIFDIEQARFAKGRFKPLAASTKARKRRQGLPRRPLQGASGDLQESLTSRGRSNIFKVDSNSLTIGSRVRHASVHQYGIGKNLPVRKPLDVTPKQRKPLANMILKYLTGEA